MKENFIYLLIYLYIKMYSSGQKRSSSPQITRTRDYPMQSYHRGRSPGKYHGGANDSNREDYHHDDNHGTKSHWAPGQTRYHHGESSSRLHQEHYHSRSPSRLHHQYHHDKSPSRLHGDKYHGRSPSRLHNAQNMHHQHYHHSKSPSRMHNAQNMHHDDYHHGRSPSRLHNTQNMHHHGSYKRLHVPEGTVGWGRNGASYRVTGTCGCGVSRPQNYDVIDDEEDDDYDEGDEYRLKYGNWRGDDPIN